MEPQSFAPLFWFGLLDIECAFDNLRSWNLVPYLTWHWAFTAIGKVLTAIVKVLGLSFIIWPFLFCTRLGDLDKPGGRANFSEISNGPKIARMAPISKIIWRNRSQRRKPSFEKVFCTTRLQKDDNENVSRELPFEYLSLCWRGSGQVGFWICRPRIRLLKLVPSGVV